MASARRCSTPRGASPALDPARGRLGAERGPSHGLHREPPRPTSAAALRAASQPESRPGQGGNGTGRPRPRLVPLAGSFAAPSRRPDRLLLAGAVAEVEPRTARRSHRWSGRRASPRCAPTDRAWAGAGPVPAACAPLTVPTPSPRRTVHGRLRPTAEPLGPRWARPAVRADGRVGPSVGAAAVREETGGSLDHSRPLQPLAVRSRSSGATVSCRSASRRTTCTSAAGGRTTCSSRSSPPTPADPPGLGSLRSSGD